YHASLTSFLSTTLPSPPISTLFPYTTLFRSTTTGELTPDMTIAEHSAQQSSSQNVHSTFDGLGFESPSFTSALNLAAGILPMMEDRKSTRLNSSHLGISYAVFCLKKKK